jgi:hypothetical protein
MKTVLKAGFVILALSASSAFAQMPWEASTMAPADVGPHDIRNANSSLWGVGG